ncbi:MAG: hypothetical protein ACM31C_05125 [Acidobacteriota bacterium]
MRLVLAIVLVCGGVAAANPAAPSPPAKCKKLVVGKGLERHVTCEITAPIVVGTHAPKPGVLIVSHDGRAVTGRPKGGDRFRGLSHQLR